MKRFLRAAKTAYNRALDYVRAEPAVKSLKQTVKDHMLTIAGLFFVSYSAYMYNHGLGILVAGVLMLVFNERVGK
jgi:hypothetical protein